MLNIKCIHDISDEDCNKCSKHGIITSCIGDCEYRPKSSYDRAFALGYEKGVKEKEELINKIKEVLDLN